MPVGLHQPENLLPVKGVKLAAVHCGIKAGTTKDDLVLIEIDDQSTVAAVFTTNKFCAAPVVLAKQYLAEDSPRYLLINSGNANAGTGEQGMKNARSCCLCVAEYAHLTQQKILPFSTGVIGTQLPVEVIQSAVPDLFKQLGQSDSANNWLAAARGIMTTDTMPKALSRQVAINGQIITITGMCKGSGMIKPDMATMLAYVATDALINKKDLQKCLNKVTDISFNAISVDGDTSTNDACVLIATGQSKIEVDDQNDQFLQALSEVFITLAQSIIRDGEGATKFIQIQVNGAKSKPEAKQLAYTIAHSPLVKTAMFASDANWGRILAAIGRAPVALDIDKVDLFLGNTCVIKNGLPDESYSEQKGQAEMAHQDIDVRVELNIGTQSATVWTTDLSYDYVKINAEYRS